MLAIDDVKKLAKMQEVLLSRTVNNRENNLEKYKDAIKQIDEYDFSNLLLEIDKINDHNQTYEGELQFLEQIKVIYEQVLEQQLNYKSVCEKYGDCKLELSNLSKINIEYIEKRINTISGYLINKKNIEDNKDKLAELNEQLVVAEKDNDALSKNLIDLENRLRESFLNAEGRFIIDGKLQYTSIISEYRDLDYEVLDLLDSYDLLVEILNSVELEKNETEEKLKTAELCYNKIPSVESKQIYDEINKEYLRIKYKLIMVKMLELLSKDYDNYNLFKKKREDLLDLIKYRHDCLTKLGYSISIDSFDTIGVSKQLEMISSFKDRTSEISMFMKNIASLNQRLEELLKQKDSYFEIINLTSDLVIHEHHNKKIFVEEKKEDIIDDRNFLDNQVVSIKNVPMKFNNGIVKQKARRVINRVYEMLNISVPKREQEVSSPELVIVPSKSFDGIDIDDNPKTNIISDKLDAIDVLDISNSDLFKTIDPFLETPLFTNKIEEDVFGPNDKGDDLILVYDDVSNSVEEDSLSIYNGESNIDIVESIDNNEVIETEMPEVFWDIPVEDIDTNGKGNDAVSFDEQIEFLVSSGEDTKIKKLAA